MIVESAIRPPSLWPL